MWKYNWSIDFYWLFVNVLNTIVFIVAFCCQFIFSNTSQKATFFFFYSYFGNDFWKRNKKSAGKLTELTRRRYEELNNRSLTCEGLSARSSVIWHWLTADHCRFNSWVSSLREDDSDYILGKWSTVPVCCHVCLTLWIPSLKEKRDKCLILSLSSWNGNRAR